MQLAVITVASQEYFRIENSLEESVYEMYTDDLKIDHLEYPITVSFSIRDILRNSTEIFAFGSVILICEGEARESGDSWFITLQ